MNYIYQVFNSVFNRKVDAFNWDGTDFLVTLYAKKAMPDSQRYPLKLYLTNLVKAIVILKCHILIILYFFLSQKCVSHFVHGEA